MLGWRNFRGANWGSHYFSKSPNSNSVRGLRDRLNRHMNIYAYVIRMLYTTPFDWYLIFVNSTRNPIFNILHSPFPSKCLLKIKLYLNGCKLNNFRVVCVVLPHISPPHRLLLLLYNRSIKYSIHVSTQTSGVRISCDEIPMGLMNWIRNFDYLSLALFCSYIVSMWFVHSS